MQKKLWDELKRPDKSPYRFKFVHGGAKKTGKRKGKRPLIPKKWTHVIFKSSRAYGRWSLLHKSHRKVIEALLYREAQRRHIDLKELVNMGNHLHMKLKFFDKELMKNFLKIAPALIARRVTGAQRGQKRGRFWQGLVFTRILSSQFEELGIRNYFLANQVERDISTKARATLLTQLNLWMKDLRAKNHSLPLPSG